MRFQSMGHRSPILWLYKCFLDRRRKRRCISFRVSIRKLLNKQDRNILKKLILTDCHPLKDITPVQKTYVHNLSKKDYARRKLIQNIL